MKEEEHGEQMSCSVVTVFLMLPYHILFQSPLPGCRNVFLHSSQPEVLGGCRDE